MLTWVCLVCHCMFGGKVVAIYLRFYGKIELWRSNTRRQAILVGPWVYIHLRGFGRLVQSFQLSFILIILLYYRHIHFLFSNTPMKAKTVTVWKSQSAIREDNFLLVWGIGWVKAHFNCLDCFQSKGLVVVSYKGKYVHKVLVNCLSTHISFYSVFLDKNI